MPDVVIDRPANPDLAWPSQRTAWTVVTLLTLANVVSLVDRQILALMVQPIRRDLDLSDTEIGLLHGFAFAIFYSALALPIARWADTGARRAIICGGVAVWSAMTAACGLARSYGQLFAARVGVGAGEATMAPAGNAMIADLFPPERRTVALGVFAAGIAGGMGLSLLAGAAVIAWAEGLGNLDVPTLGTLRPWQTVFIVLGLAGFPVAAALYFVPEPPRRDSGTMTSWREVVDLAKRQGRTLGGVIAGYTLLVASANGIAAWTPAFYIRTYELTAPEAGAAMGAVILAGGPLGGWLGGAATDWLRRRGDASAPVKVLFWCSLAMIAPAAAGSLMPGAGSALFFLFWTFLLGSATVGPTIAALHGAIPTALRAQIVAVLYFFVNLIGLGTGPVAVAAVTDGVFRDELAVRWSIAIVATIYTVAGAVCCWTATRANSR